MKITDFQNMSDEDIAGLTDSSFDTSDIVPEEQQEEQTETTPPVDEEVEDKAEADEVGAAGDNEEGEKPKDEDVSDSDFDKQTPPTEQVAVEKTVEEKKKPPVAEEPKEGNVPAEEAPSINYEEAYKKLIGQPIKANGTEITLRDADEALRLIQKGAGYEKKMEALKPARKSAAMLEAAGLLGDDTALSHMIDLYNGNPQAIARLVKDLKIDIFALDLDAGDQYRAVSHLQTDEAVTFTETLKEVRTLEGGKEALALIDSWDQPSKDAIWGNAEAVRQIFEYKQSGVYDTVATEVERRRTLGQIPAGTPFIHAFKQVGDEMARAAEAQNPSPAVERTVNTPANVPAKPVARTPVHSGPAPRKVETPDVRAAAAASPRVGSGVAKQVPDIYSLSDKDIENMSSPPA
jgi:hypothetical protein